MTQVSKDGWIAVEDELPPFDVPVFVYDESMARWGESAYGIGMFWKAKRKRPWACTLLLQGGGYECESEECNPSHWAMPKSPMEE